MTVGRRKENEENGPCSYQVKDIDFSCNQTKGKKRVYSLEDEVVEASGGGGEEESSCKRRKLEGSESQGGSSGDACEGDGDDSNQQGGGQPPGGSGGGGQPPRQSHHHSSLPPSPPKKYIQHVFGVNAWKKWVASKNEELAKEGSSEGRYGTELLRLAGDELCKSLSMFVAEFRKPSGQPYPSDVMYYLILGIQEYLRVNGREDDIFTDPQFDKFTDTFDDIIGKETLLDNAEFLVPRIEEEHLWESYQLGIYSPFSLLLTMLYITTKGLFITDIDSHMNLAFSQLMKQWPRGQNSTEKQVIKYSSLRYFPPGQPVKDDSSNEGSSSQEYKKRFELFVDQDNSFRCPIHLYDYYVSKCPESVRNRSDVFYLQPEMSYLADSPFWYTTEPLDRTQLTKMFNRLRLVKEISLVLNFGSSECKI